MRVRTTTSVIDEARVLPEGVCARIPDAHWPGLSMRELNAAVSPQELHSLIEEHAYCRAQARGFAPGHELEDWLAAEREVHDALLLTVRVEGMT